MPHSQYVQVKWQEGPLREGVNGATVQDVLNVALLKVESMLENKALNCREYARARLKIEEGILWMNKPRGK